ncbi:MAG: PspA/IM30 family protein, partial [Gammaproteobacteria bacterium]|nr:PspA/IM30 family protein [Gammaproteobacteria bacterium]
RTRRDAMSARYSAAQAQVKAGEAITGVSSELSELTRALGRAEEKTDRMQARAYAIDELIDSGALALPGGDGDIVERELREITVEEELASYKAELIQGKPAPALTDGNDQGERREP